MPRRLIVVRPEPGNARTVAAGRRAGLATEAVPLFEVRPLAWSAPDPAGFDALLLTSANAARHGGPGLARLAGLPLLAVGKATAAAARAAGLVPVMVGTADGRALIAAAAGRGYHRLLHLAGRDHIVLPGAAVIAVYASEPLTPPFEWSDRVRGTTVLLHSARAAQHVSSLTTDRKQVAIAAISPAVLVAAGNGWCQGVAAAVPTDAALLAAAAALTD